MTDYAVGDIQGCFQPLQDVLDKVDFSPSRDRLWVAGDLVNRGPSSLATLRYIHSLGNAADVVLGNHDLHLLAVNYGGHPLKRKDTIQQVLDAEDATLLLDWLRHQHLAVYDADRDLFMSHAGLPHIWSASDAVACAGELESVLRSPDAADYFREMYGNQPERWSPDLTGMGRLRVMTNYLTRMRFVAQDGTLELTAKESISSAPEGFEPWFAYPRADNTRVVFGHWAALEGKTGADRYIALDTGCVWGGELTLMNLDSGERICCDCES
ncbi:symmetrical bis(5'-nucleosyl)-tetraphosphatase [Marinobacter sp. BGYM27]|uniref:symmetrical bis(5'-nucleosyl)-tetraphosphatase n=1 Tax=Marinobacter sp. BGYM27 TaxID=2975597 RepID=UPI0021A543B0|nr:symmetrical bis(5'-nucleosyl)-tetraphosphatase [Marinobacter sp. BGYM27]MDG5501437.1 symmetrical bis(5'-nucleosyl)-tetraphosphatase [Marinobacter sp. BGYM27]